jgi:hypothetical protein
MKLEFLDGYAVGFKMAVKECFKEAILRERFSPGDIIYNTPKAYLATWGEAMEHIEYCFQVVSASPDYVEFEVLCPNHNRTHLIIRERIKEPPAHFIRRIREGIFTT